MDYFFRWLPMAVLAGMMAVAKLRAWIMHRRGLRVVVVDLHRPKSEMLHDSLVIAVAAFWFYLLIAEAWPLSLTWLPDPLTRKLLDAVSVRIVGMAMLILAPVLYAAALGAMSTSWRIGIDRQQPGPLVTSGVFAWSRNPIYAAFDLVVCGTILIHGRVVFLLVGAIFMLLIHGVVLREERFLADRFGDEFQRYRRRVGRYFPWW
jgi:protein-S-isoprenylcysteine O-methyltransferase Ste14